jgi:ubiquinone/menaquinone biosynthesis C-methylase UbiE
MGAEVTVADFSEANGRYATELAQEAGVKLDYIVSDVLGLPEAVLDGSYDLVFAEMGIVHYFTDLAPFMTTAYRLLAPGGKFVLRDFHPVTTKLISSKGSTAKVRKHKVSGDYSIRHWKRSRCLTPSICLLPKKQRGQTDLM